MTIEFRYARRTMLRWQQYAVAGASKEEAVAIARHHHDIYEGKWLQASPDGGATWFDVPPAREIPTVDEREIHTGKIWGG